MPRVVPPEGAPPPWGGPAATPGARLLVADDNKVYWLLLGRSLEVLGHRVAMAENGRVALEMLRRERYDLLLLDMEMPEYYRLRGAGAPGGGRAVARPAGHRHQPAWKAWPTIGAAPHSEAGR